MITLIAAFFAAHIATILAGLAAVLGVGWGAFKHQQANTAIAKAQATVANNNAAVADGNAVASAAAEQSVKNSAEAQQAARDVPDADLDAELAKIGSLRKD